REDLVAAHAFDLDQLLAAHTSDVERLRSTSHSEIEKIVSGHAAEIARRDAQQHQLVEELVAEKQADHRTRLVDMQAQIADLQSQLAMAMAERAQSVALQTKTAAALEESQRERARLDGLVTELMAHQTRVAAAGQSQRARAEQAEQALGDSTLSKN